MNTTTLLDEYWFEISDLTIFHAALWMVTGHDPRRHDERYEIDSDYAEDFDREHSWSSMVQDKCDLIISAVRAKLIPMTLEVNLTGQTIGEFYLPAVRIDPRFSRIRKADWIDWCRQNGYSDFLEQFVRKSENQVEAAASLAENQTDGGDSLQVSDDETSSARLIGNNPRPAGIGRRGILAVDWPLHSNFNQRSFSRALSDVPKWLMPARVFEGARGKASALWNPALVAECLAGKGHANRRALTTIIRNHFSEWLDEWEQLQAYQ